METLAVVLSRPQCLTFERLPLPPVGAGDVVVDVAWSGISTGTERLLYEGRMPAFPGMGYPLVPGYESVGRIVAAGPDGSARIGETVFVPGATCFGEVRGLFGGTASRLVVPSARAVAIDPVLAERGALLALAATAHHAVAEPGTQLPDLIVGHGVLGRLIARIVLATGGPPPMVWETNPQRRDGAYGYAVTRPDRDSCNRYKYICDASGDPNLLDGLIARLAPGGEIVLAGFYADRMSFAFPPAFMREARLRIAAQWLPRDLDAARRLVEQGQLSLDGLITHRSGATQADAAYRTAFGDPACLKMILDWSGCA